MWQDYNALQQLAIEQAFYKRLAADVDTKTKGSLRWNVDQQVRGYYETTGAKSYDVRLGEHKVGTMSVKVSKDVPEKRTQVFTVADESALYHWFPSDDSVDRWLYEHWREFAAWYFKQTGELPDGCELAERIVPGTPAHVNGTTLRVYPDKVAAALGSELPTAIAGLLGGGADE